MCGQVLVFCVFSYEWSHNLVNKEDASIIREFFFLLQGKSLEQIWPILSAACISSSNISRSSSSLYSG